jgi:hypothetical protein
VRRVGLLEACDDPQLFGLPLWPRQRERLAEVDAGPRLHVWALGRRSSKTTMKALVGLWCCLLRPELLAFLRPGERGYAVGVATNHRQARLLVQAALSIVERSPLLGGMVESATEDEIRFTNSTAFAAFPCSSRGGRGWPIFCLLLDEFAHFLTETEGPQVADNVWQALIPSTAQFGDLARVVVGSTPWGSAGLFAELFQKAVSGELAGAVAHRAGSAEMNPTLTAEFLEAERVVLGEEAFAAEYLADFSGTGAAYLDPVEIEAAVGERGELPPEFGTGWIAGLDPAFSSDPFGFAIVGRDPLDRRRLLLGKAWSRRPSKRKPETFAEESALRDELLDEVAEECVRYRARVVTDQYKARGVVEYLQRKGLSVRAEPMSATSKTLAFSALRARLNLHALELYKQSELLAELRRLRSQYRAGAAAVVNPRVGGSHGDIAQALALAVWEHDRWGMRLGAELPPLREPTPETAALSAGLADMESGFVRCDPTRQRRWYDRDDGEGIGGMEF